MERRQEIISRAYAKAGNVTIKALCVSSLGEAFVMLDKDGKELGNSPIYMDKRGEKECEDLIEKLGPEEIMNITGHPPHSMYSVCKLMWQQRNMPRVYARIHKILFYGDYILHKLGGQYVSDYSLARTMCFNITEKQWPQNNRVCRPGYGNFPETGKRHCCRGNIASIADELGVNKGIKLVLGGKIRQWWHWYRCNKKRTGHNGTGTVDRITPVLDPIKQKYDGGFHMPAPYLFEDMYVTYA